MNSCNNELANFNLCVLISRDRTGHKFFAFGSEFLSFPHFRVVRFF